MRCTVLDHVAARNVGDKVLLFSEEEFALRAVVEMLEQDGATVVRKPVKVGSKWVAAVRPDSSLD